MIGAILSAIPSIIGMINSDNAKDEYLADIEGVKSRQRLSPSALAAKAMLAENATRGLAGYETQKQDIYSQVPTTLNQAKDWLTGGGVVDFLARSSADTAQQLRQLNASDEQARNQNRMMYANYLGSAMAGEENRLAGVNNELDLAGANAGVYSSAAQNNFLTSMVNNLGKSTTDDWTNLIAGLSKNKQEIPTPQALAPKMPVAATFGDEPGQKTTYEILMDQISSKYWNK